MLGLDPDPDALWPHAGGSPGAGGSGLGFAGAGDPGGPAAAERVAAAVERHCLALIDAAGRACVAVKPQLACFERLGPAGRRTLGAVVEHARASGLLVIADGKRGDIDVTARAYAQALFGGLQTPFGRVPGLGADLATVNPLMGVDAIEPFVAAARARGGVGVGGEVGANGSADEIGAGVLVLVRTSNPGACDVEDLPVQGGGAVWERLAAIVERLGADGVGESGLSDVGAVIGATEPDHLARARELMPAAPFLLPGVGAQGGRVQALAPAFAPGRAGGLVSASRSIVDAYRSAGGEPAAAALAEAERLRAIAWELA